MAILWVYNEKIGEGSTGGTTSYFQESYQKMLLKNGRIKTDYGVVPEGRWDDLEDDETEWLSAEGYTALDLEHNYNGRLHAVVCRAGKIVYLMHAYKTSGV